MFSYSSFCSEAVLCALCQGGANGAKGDIADSHYNYL